jgi:hypothetical protein
LRGYQRGGSGEEQEDGLGEHFDCFFERLRCKKWKKKKLVLLALYGAEERDGEVVCL